MLLSIGVITCGIIILVYVIFRWKMRHILRDTKNIQGIESYPLIGSAHLAFGKNNEGIFKTMESIFSLAWNDPIKFWIGPVFVVVVANVDDIQAVTYSPNCIEKHYVYNFFDSHGLFSAPSKIWKPERKILNPTFNLKILKSFLPIFKDSSKTIVKNLEMELGKGEFDVSDYLFSYTFETICKTALGHDIRVSEKKNDDFLYAVKNGCILIAERIFRIWLHPDFIYKKTLKYKQEQNYRETFYKVSQEIIDKKRIEDENSPDKNKNKISLEDGEFKKPEIFLNQLLTIAKEHKFSDQHIKDHVNTMVFAGTETTTFTVSYILLMLGNYPDIQERVFEEIKEHYSSEDDINNVDLSKLVYLEMVIKETMRLYPIGPFIGRITTGDVKLKNYTLPVGVSIIISYYHLHRDPNVWGPNAEKFNPDHFLPENMSKRNPNSFGGFSLGLRNCIGWRYAMMTMKIVLSELLLTYKVHTTVKPEQFRHALDITLKLLNGYRITIEKRNK